MNECTSIDISQDQAVDISYFDRDVTTVAQDLLGMVLVHQLGDERVAGFIVETEAYGGAEDPASHAAFRKNGLVTAMWKPAGTIYVFKAFGMYPCFNIVTGSEGSPSAVLFRAVSLISDAMPPLIDNKAASGPGRLGRAFGFTTGLNGRMLSETAIWIQPGSQKPESVSISTAPRIGISRGMELPWRYALSGHPAVSRPRI